MDGSLHYNVDARFDDDVVDLGKPEDTWPIQDRRLGVLDPLNGDLDPSQRMELLTHRCFVVTRWELGTDAWPYHDTLTTDLSGTPL